MDCATLRHEIIGAVQRLVIAFAILQAFVPVLAFAAPLSQNVGAARVTLSASPDPPGVGSNDFVVQINGVPIATLDKTTVRFSTLMPTMNMTGPSGAALRAGTDSWRFTAMLGMAGPWSVHVALSGGMSGSVTFIFNVGAHASQAMPRSANASQLAVGNQMTNAAPMAGMNMSAGNPGAWETAFFALLAAIIAGFFIVRRDRRPIAIALGVLAIAAIVSLAFAQARYGAQAMDMNSMSQAQGNAPIPVTLATVGGDPDSTTIAAPANVQPYLTQNILARAPGLLTDLSAYTGDRISGGEVVAHLVEPELQSNARAAHAAARAALIEAMHHAPNGVVIARNDVRAAQSDQAAAQAEIAAKAQQVSYWRSEMAREKELLAQGAVSQREYQDEVAQAAAALAAFQAAKEKAAATRVQVASAQTRMSDAHASVEMAQAQAAQAGAAAQAQNVTAGYTNLIVPDNAIVVKRLVDPGVYVQAGTPILQVAVIDRLRVQAQVAQSDIASVHVGAPIDVRFEAGRTLRGRISSVSPVADPTTHTAIAEAIVENPGSRLQPGGFANVVIHVQTRYPNNTFSIPSASIVGGQSSAVWIDADGIAHRVPVSVFSDDGTTAQVRGNELRNGMRVVVAGAQSLEEGQPITGAAQ